MFYCSFIAVVRRVAIKQKREFVILQFYYTCIRTLIIKQPTTKQRFVLFYFYLSFIALVRSNLVQQVQTRTCTAGLTVYPYHGSTYVIPFTVLLREVDAANSISRRRRGVENKSTFTQVNSHPYNQSICIYK